MEKDDIILTPREAMAYLRISKDTLYKLVKRKDLPTHKVGARYRFRKSELDKLLDK